MMFFNVMLGLMLFCLITLAVPFELMGVSASASAGHLLNMSQSEARLAWFGGALVWAFMFALRGRLDPRALDAEFAERGRGDS